MELLDFQINQENLLKLLSSDSKGLGELFKNIVERLFYVGEAEIERRTLIHWEKEGLLPFPSKTEGWRKFSLVEYVWLRCISGCRSLRLPPEKIKINKKFFFKIDMNEYKTLFLETIESFTSDIHEKEHVLAVFKRKDIPEDIWLEAMQDVQLSVLNMLILEV